MAEKSAYVLCFASLLGLVVAVSAVVFSAYGVIAPGLAGIGDRDQAVRELITPLALLATAVVVFIVSWGWVPRRLIEETSVP